MPSKFNKIATFPFVLLERIEYHGESLLTHLSRSRLTPDAKIRLAKEVLFDKLAARDPVEWHRFETYVNAVNIGTPLAKAFASNLIRHFFEYESQVGQDCFIDTVYGGKAGGTFVEIGVGDGRNISNTYFLEKHRGWSGVLCEPAKVFHERIRSSRSALLITDAVYDRTGVEIEFNEVVGKEELSTLAGQSISDTHDRSNSHSYSVGTISFNDLYERHVAGKRIDYLSIDTEGSELKILKAIDFDKIEIAAISVEHNYDRAKHREISDHLERNGYAEVIEGVFEIDAMFLKREFEEMANVIAAAAKS